LNSIIRANDLTKRYDQKIAVDHVSFSVAEGEIFGFLGPNGAGKTTTIRMLTTLAAITEGSASIAGFDVSTKPNQVRRSIGLVPQEAAVDIGLTGIENLLLDAKLYHISTDVARRRSKELLDLVGLQEAAGRLVGTYSGGMKKRLEVISGLMHEPQVLFLDEPTLGLDIQTRSAMWEYIRGINKEKKMTIFLTTHYLEEADSLCGRIAIIDHGKIKVSGSPSNLKSELGGDTIDFEVSDSTIDLEAILAHLSEVREVKPLGNNWYRVKVPRIEKSIQRVFDELSLRGVRLLNTKFEKASLDQVFLETTGRSMREEVSSGSMDSFVLRAQSRMRSGGRN